MRLSLAASLALLSALMGLSCSNSNNNPTTPSATVTTPTGPVSELFESTLATGGATTRSFVATQSGTTTVQLTNVSQNFKVGLGIGLANVSGTICALAVSVNTAGQSTPQLSVPVDAGTYCVEIFDVGNLPPKSLAAFSITVVHP
jgi:hypothetical protein